MTTKPAAKPLSPATQKMLDEMIAFGRGGRDILPMFFQPLRGRSNTVSAAIRAGKKLGLLVEAGLDGSHKPFYRVALPTATHEAPKALQ